MSKSKCADPIVEYGIWVRAPGLDTMLAGFHDQQ
jgi:hypothetical protein